MRSRRLKQRPEPTSAAPGLHSHHPQGPRHRPPMLTALHCVAHARDMQREHSRQPRGWEGGRRHDAADSVGTSVSPTSAARARGSRASRVAPAGTEGHRSRCVDNVPALTGARAHAPTAPQALPLGPGTPCRLCLHQEALQLQQGCESPWAGTWGYTPEPSHRPSLQRG